MESYYLKIIDIVKETMSCNAHALDHVLRVCNLCEFLSKYEKDIDYEVLKPASLLHDIARGEEMNDRSIDHSVLGAEKAGEILLNISYPPEKIPHIQQCILTHRFKSDNPPQSIEAKILFDADKLDVLGSVGIARSFMIAGQYGQRIFVDTNIEEYVCDNLNGKRINDITKHSPNIEFETKFKNIPKRLYTEKAITIARERLYFMTKFFSRLALEVGGDVYDGETSKDIN